VLVVVYDLVLVVVSFLLSLFLVVLLSLVGSMWLVAVFFHLVLALVYDLVALA